MKTTDRLVDSPAIIVDHEPAAVRKVMRMVESSDYQATLPKQVGIYMRASIHLYIAYIYMCVHAWALVSIKNIYGRTHAHAYAYTNTETGNQP